MHQVTFTTQQTFLSPEEIADHIQVSRRTVMRWIKTGQLPALRIGNVTRVPTDAYQQFLNDHFFSAQALRLPSSLAQELITQSRKEEAIVEEAESLIP